MRRQNESLTARVTFEGHVSGVIQHRLFIIAHLRQFLIAVIPLRFLSGVNLHVTREVPLMPEIIPALMAGEGPLSEMNDDVFLKVSLAREALVALRAGEGLLSVVNEQVILKVDFLRVALPALKTHVRPLAVNRHVILQVSFTFVALSAMRAGEGFLGSCILYRILFSSCKTVRILLRDILVLTLLFHQV